MSKPTAVFAIAAAMLGVTSVYLAHSLRVERARLAAVLTAAAGPNLSTGVGSQQQHPKTVHSTPDTLPVADPTARTPPQGAVAQSNGPPDGTSQVVVSPSARNTSSRSAELAYRRLELEKQYPDLVAVLNLQRNEAEGFFDLLARQQLADAEEEMASMHQGASDGRERERERERQRQSHKAEQAAFLGDARMTDWNKYMNSLGGRAVARELRMLLADSDYPLRRDQYEPLVTIVAAEQIRHNDQREQLRRSMRDPTNPTADETVSYMNKRQDLIEESLKRRRRAAATVLDIEQRRQYDIMLEAQRLRSRIEYDALVTGNGESAQEKAKVGQ